MIMEKNDLFSLVLNVLLSENYTAFYLVQSMISHDSPVRYSVVL